MRDARLLQVAPACASALDGHRVCIFAYGQTGSGKTHTMEGPPEDRGVNFRALAELFALARSADAADAKLESSFPANGGYVFTVSMLEVYNEEIRDLLRADSVDAAELVPTLEVRRARFALERRTALSARPILAQVRQRKKGGVYVENLTRVEARRAPRLGIASRLFFAHAAHGCAGRRAGRGGEADGDRRAQPLDTLEQHQRALEPLASRAFGADLARLAR